MLVILTTIFIATTTGNAMFCDENGKNENCIDRPNLTIEYVYPHGKK